MLFQKWAFSLAFKGRMTCRLPAPNGGKLLLTCSLNLFKAYLYITIFVNFIYCKYMCTILLCGPLIYPWAAKVPLHLSIFGQNQPNSPGLSCCCFNSESLYVSLCSPYLHMQSSALYRFWYFPIFCISKQLRVIYLFQRCMKVQAAILVAYICYL